MARFARSRLTGTKPARFFLGLRPVGRGVHQITLTDERRRVSGNRPIFELAIEPAITDDELLALLASKSAELRNAATTPPTTGRAPKACHPFRRKQARSPA